MTSNSPIFILGMPRSGTTLVRSILSAHPRIVVSPELHFFGSMQRFRDVDLKQSDHFCRFWNIYTAGKWFKDLSIDPETIKAKVLQMPAPDFRGIFLETMQAYATSVGKSRWGEKTPRNYMHIETLLDWFPDARVIFVLRDPLATIASNRKTPWGQKISVETHAAEWRRAVRVHYRWQQDERFWTVRYEDLVQDQETEIRSLCAFLDENFHDEMIAERDQSIVQAKQTGWAETALQLATRPVHTDSLDKWRTVLSEQDVGTICSIGGPLLESYGYLTEETASTPRNKAIALRADAVDMRMAVQRILRTSACRLGLMKRICDYRLLRESSKTAPPG